MQSPDEKSMSSLDLSKYSYNHISYIETEDTVQYDLNSNDKSNSASLSLLSEFGVSVRRNNDLYDEMLGVYDDDDDDEEEEEEGVFYNDDNNITSNYGNGQRKNSTFLDIIAEDISSNDPDTTDNAPNNFDSNDSNDIDSTQKLDLPLSYLSQKRSNELDNDFQKQWDKNSSEHVTKKSKIREEGNFSNRGAKETMNLTKDMLPNLRIIGQLEDSVILAMSGDVIVAIDQHAADERIKLEKLSMHFPNNDIAFLDNKFSKQNLHHVDIEMSIDQYTAAQLIDFNTIILSWGFLYEIVSSNTQNDEYLKTLHVTRVPVVEGDQLSIQDLLEFVHYLDTNSTLPSSACKPPAVNRILNNKACKTAIKFGDKLSVSQCNKLVKDLSTTAFPFQCAHNRPSIAPLINLSPVINEQSPIMQDIQYSNIIKRLYGL